MTDDNSQNGRDATQQFISILESFEWRIIGFLAFLIITILFLTLGFWRTILAIVLRLIGVGIGYIKDHIQGFLGFLSR